MNSFKFVVRPDFLKVGVNEHTDYHYLQIDITTIMQYLCIHDLILDSNYHHIFNFYNLLNNDNKLIITGENYTNNKFITLCTQVFNLQYERKRDSVYNHKYICKNGEYIRKDNIYKLFTFDHGSFDEYLDLLNTDDSSSVLSLRAYYTSQKGLCGTKGYKSDGTHCVNYGIYQFNNNNIVNKIFDDYLKQLINTRKRIHNTMSDLVVYTDDSEIIKQVIRNNQEIINELKNSDKCDNYIEKNRTDLCNKLCKKQDTTVRKRKQVSIE